MQVSPKRFTRMRMRIDTLAHACRSARHRTPAYSYSYKWACLAVQNFCKNNLQCVGNPSCQQTVAASKSSQWESPHTLPQFLATQISTLPKISFGPPTKRTSPLSHSVEIKNCKQHHTHDASLTSGYIVVQFKCFSLVGFYGGGNISLHNISINTSNEY